ncbi:VWA domain-containing protein [Nocardioides zeae]|uniref:VWA domain-containing protein n=1 Tax=Nocardioides imazamoxiresistens TaxID=3231893 RepID=A0ABU3PT41_9ACTN|nr:VWA domain-containing protein [Nocardioides zeae]MDT9592369.1 VWA domain-containing protein [Nocardioides zeae]
MVDLTKRAGTAQGAIISLLKREADRGVDLGEITARVVVAIDYSASMRARYENGEVQDLVERVLALSLAGLDDDGDIQVHFFHNEPFSSEVVDSGSYAGFVDRWRQRRDMGGTNYGGVIKAILAEAGHAKLGLGKRLFGRGGQEPAGPAAIPTLVLFVTDGEPWDKDETKRLLVDASSKPVFWQFLGLGYAPKFLEDLDTMSGRTVDNVGLTSMGDSKATPDETWFPTVLEEYVTSWTPAARQAGLIV